MQCTQCEILLEDYESGNLATLEQKAVDQHLKHCDECASQLAYLFEVKLMSSQWQDETVPNWNPRQIFSADSHTSIHAIRHNKQENLLHLSWNQLLATAASVVVVTLVLANFFLANTATQSLVAGDYVNYEQLNERFKNLEEDLEEDQNEKLTQVAYQLRNQQLESSQLLLTSLLDVNRQERRQDMNNLMATWVQFQGEQTEPTVQGLRYLLAKQQQDDVQLEQLRTVINERNSKF